MTVQIDKAAQIQPVLEDLQSLTEGFQFFIDKIIELKREELLQQIGSIPEGWERLFDLLQQAAAELSSRTVDFAPQALGAVEPLVLGARAGLMFEEISATEFFLADPNIALQDKKKGAKEQADSLKKLLVDLCKRLPDFLISDDACESLGEVINEILGIIK
jgi:hypothetical protein